MRYSQAKIYLILTIFLSSCYSGGSPFFIRNYEDEKVTVHYKYYDGDAYKTKVDQPPPTSVMHAKEILKKKQLYPFFRSPMHFYSGELQVTMLDSLNYTFSIPPYSSVRIEPIYHYAENVEYMVLNQSDTIRFTEDFPGVEKETLFYEDLFKKKFSLVGSGYSLLDVKLKDIREALAE